MTAAEIIQTLEEYHNLPPEVSKLSTEDRMIRILVKQQAEIKRLQEKLSHVRI